MPKLRAGALTPHLRCGTTDPWWCCCSPTFIFKVPRGEAAFTVLVSNFPVLTVDKPTTCLFTLADEYRASPHTCTPVLAVNFWNEFAQNKDLVLIRATILPGVALSRSVR
eukprot:COSAG02_NODE_11200_length_1772_cov_2.823670_2_plen_110_part_00